MKAHSTEQLDAFGISANETEQISDPFAVDLFAANRLASDAATTQTEASSAEETKEEANYRSSVPWHARLPRLDRDHARLSAALVAAPTYLSSQVIEALCQTIGRYTYAACDPAITVVDLREADLSFAANDFERRARIWASLSVEPSSALIAAELDSGFAAKIVDRMLGGEGREVESAFSALSKIEQSLIEFLSLNFVHELNSKASTPLFRLDSVATTLPVWLAAATAHEGESSAVQSPDRSNSRGIILAVRVQVTSITGLVRLYVSAEALAALNAEQNPLLFEANIRHPQEKLKHYKRIAPSASLHLMVGTTEISAGELADLDYGDVVVADDSYVTWRDGEFWSSARIRVGDGRGTIITGEILREFYSSGEDSEEKEAAIRLRVETFLGGDEQSEVERLRMDEDFNGAEENLEADTNESAAALDGLLLTLHVELAARRISLDELSRLRAGQILDLGCKATDPVSLLSEGRRVARGELVDLEGRLGVRITQVSR